MAGLAALCEKLKEASLVKKVPAAKAEQKKTDERGYGDPYSFMNQEKPKEPKEIQDLYDRQEPSMLSQASEYIRQSYCDILASIASQSTTSPAARDFLSLLMKEAAVKENVTDAVRRGMECRIEDYEAFARELRTSPLRYRFMLDGFLLTMDAGGEERQQAMLAKWGTILGITFEEGKYLFLQAEALIRQNADLCNEAGKVRPLSIVLDGIKPYFALCFAVSSIAIHPIIESNTIKIEPLVNRKISSSELNNLLQEENAKNKEKEKLKKTIDTVILKNLRIHAAGAFTNFTGRKAINMYHCDFDGTDGAGFYLRFVNCGKVMIDSCQFHDFSNPSSQVCCPLIYEKLVDQMEFVNTEFRDCLTHHLQFSYWDDYRPFIASMFDRCREADDFETIYNHCKYYKEYCSNLYQSHFSYLTDKEGKCKAILESLRNGPGILGDTLSFIVNYMIPPMPGDSIEVLDIIRFIYDLVEKGGSALYDAFPWKKRFVHCQFINCIEDPDSGCLLRSTEPVICGGPSLVEDCHFYGCDLKRHTNESPLFSITAHIKDCTAQDSTMMREKL